MWFYKYFVIHLLFLFLSYPREIRILLNSLALFLFQMRQLKRRNSLSDFLRLLHLFRSNNRIQVSHTCHFPELTPFWSEKLVSSHMHSVFLVLNLRYWPYTLFVTIFSLTLPHSLKNSVRTFISNFLLDFLW